MTIATDNFYRSGLNGRVQEFYINKATDRLVLAVEFSNLRLYSNDSYVFYHRRSKEPIINKTYIHVFIRSMTITIIIPNIKDLQLRLGETYSYYNSPDVSLDLGPNAFNGSDPGLQRAKSEAYAQVLTVFREGILVDTEQNIINYIQYNICDSGL